MRKRLRVWPGWARLRVRERAAERASRSVADRQIDAGGVMLTWQGTALGRGICGVRRACDSRASSRFRSAECSRKLTGGALGDDLGDRAAALPRCGAAGNETSTQSRERLAHCGVSGVIDGPHGADDCAGQHRWTSGAHRTCQPARSRTGHHCRCAYRPERRDGVELFPSPIGS